MQTVLIAIRNYADDDSGNVDIHSRLTVKPFKKMKGAGRLFLLKNVDSRCAWPLCLPSAWRRP